MRKEINLVISEEGRDKGKNFHIVEMAAVRAEKWATKALMKLAKANSDLGDISNLAQRGMQGMAMLGMQALTQLEYEEVEPLFDELMSCVMIANGMGGWRTPLEDDFEEVSTLLQLKWAVFNLHVNFLQSGKPSGSSEAPLTTQTSSTSPNTSTSPQPSPQFSQSARTKRRR